MSFKIVFSPAARKKLLETRGYIEQKAGKPAAERVIKSIMHSINLLKEDPYLGTPVKSFVMHSKDLFFLRTAHYYVFYLVEGKLIKVVQVYSERENFMQKLFGVSLRTPESIEYWGE